MSGAEPGSGSLRTLLRNMPKAEKAKKQPSKKRKGALSAKDKALLESMGLPTKRITKATIKAEWRRKAKALPLATRQLILDLVWQGKTFGEIARQAGVDTDTIFGVMELNTDRIPVLRTESR